MWILYLTAFLDFLLLICAVMYNTSGLWTLTFCGLGLLLLYGIIKQAVKSALQEYNREKEQAGGQK